MKKELKLRRCEVLDDIQGGPSESKVRGEWEEVPFKDLKKGQVFRLFDDNEDVPPVEDGTSVYVALSNAAPTEPEGNYVVQSLELAGW
jgi:hypothetical protein